GGAAEHRLDAVAGGYPLRVFIFPFVPAHSCPCSGPRAWGGAGVGCRRALRRVDGAGSTLAPHAPVPGRRNRSASYLPSPNPYAPGAAHRERRDRRRLAEFIELHAHDLEGAKLVRHEGRELAERQAVVPRHVTQHGLRVCEGTRVLVVLV